MIITDQSDVKWTHVSTFVEVLSSGPCTLQTFSFWQLGIVLQCWNFVTSCLCHFVSCQTPRLRTVHTLLLMDLFLIPTLSGCRCGEIIPAVTETQMAGIRADPSQS